MTALRWPASSAKQEHNVAILLTCGCGRKLQIDDRFAGQQGRCPSCGETIDIPDHARNGPPPLPVQRRSVPPPLPATVDDYPPPQAVPASQEPPPGPLTNHGGGALGQD